MSTAYRSESAALRERYLALETELAETLGAQAQRAGLEAKEAQLREEMAALTRMIARARRQIDTPLLAKVSVASPCPARWEDMAGDERARFCGGCQKNVYNLSALNAAEAEALLSEKSGELCVRYYQRADGTVMTQDCPDGARRKRTRKLAVLAAGAFGVTAAAWGARAHMHMGEPLQGDVSVAPRPETTAPLLGATQSSADPPTPVLPVPPVSSAPPPSVPRPRPTMGVVAATVGKRVPTHR